MLALLRLWRQHAIAGVGGQPRPPHLLLLLGPFLSCTLHLCQHLRPRVWSMVLLRPRVWSMVLLRPRPH
jgi:hypothetical protein